MTTITVPKNLRNATDLLVVERQDFENLSRENEELRLAMKAVASGEMALRGGKTRSMRDFLKSRSLYAKNR